MKRLSIFIFLVFLFSCKDEPFKNLDSRLKSRVALISAFHGYEVGPYEFGDPDHKDTTHPYFYLRDSTSLEDLRLLTGYPDELVKIYSFRALAEKKDTSLYRIITQHLSDTAEVEIRDYDYGWSSTVEDQLIRLGLRQLDRKQKDALRDSIILGHDSLNIISEILFNLKPLEKYYAKVKTLAEKNRCESAYIALAAYRKQEDIPIIQKGFKEFNQYRGEIFKAAELFPDTVFIPFLLSYPTKLNPEVLDWLNSMDYFYKALANYQRPECFAMLDSIAASRDKPGEISMGNNKESIFEALHKYYCPMYKELHDKLEKEMPDYIMEHLGKPDYTDVSPWWEINN